jgi:hypothetical protein
MAAALGVLPIPNAAKRIPDGEKQIPNGDK